MAIINARSICFYHPIKVIFLDDNPEFLEALDLEFSSKLNMIALTDPDRAMELIESHNQDVIQPVSETINGVNVDTISGRLVDTEVSHALNLLYNATRFSKVAVLVVDYQMPDINGIDFCKKLKERKIFKIMLTAEADKDTAINAFNDGLIDKFILKTNEELYSELSLAVHDLTQRYFRELSWSIINGYFNSIPNLFSNELYQKLFSDTATQAQAVEYYLVDNSGSILFLDKDANYTWFIIRHVNELIEQLNLLKGYELPEDIMDSITKKEKILFLLSEKEYKKPLSKWVEYMFDSKKLDGNYYYSIIRDYPTDCIDWEKVASYSTYIAEINSNG